MVVLYWIFYFRSYEYFILEVFYIGDKDFKTQRFSDMTSLNLELQSGISRVFREKEKKKRNIGFIILLALYSWNMILVTLETDFSDIWTCICYWCENSNVRQLIRRVCLSLFFNRFCDTENSLSLRHEMALDANGKRLLATSSSVRAPIYKVHYFFPFFHLRFKWLMISRWKS